jgi:hypothetical protein
MTPDAELNARDFTTLVAGGAGRDSEPDLVQQWLLLHALVAHPERIHRQDFRMIAPL